MVEDSDRPHHLILGDGGMVFLGFLPHLAAARKLDLGCHTSTGEELSHTLTRFWCIKRSSMNVCAIATEHEDLFLSSESRVRGQVNTMLLIIEICERAAETRNDGEPPKF